MPKNYAGAAKFGAAKRSEDSVSRADSANPGSPDRPAVLKPQLPAPDAAVPVQPPNPEGAEHVEIRRASRFGSQFAAQQRFAEASQSPRTRPGRSPRLALFSHQARGVEGMRNCLARSQTVAQFRQRRSLRNLLDLPKQVVRQGHSSHGGTGLQTAMQSIRHIAKLNHL